MDPNPLHILILAAGASSRMGARDKLLEPVDGVPLLTRLAAEALRSGCPTTVVLPPDRPLRQEALAGLPVRQVIALHARDGMAESLKSGLLDLPEAADVLLVLADLPEIGAEDLMAMIRAHAAHPERIIRATSQAGMPGHPVLFPARLRPALLRLKGDQGARDILRTEADQILPLPLPGSRAVTDLDTPEDWAAWRALRGG
jgi:CTP:molybdopterin cytidylyltransferase MocA